MKRLILLGLLGFCTVANAATMDCGDGYSAEVVDGKLISVTLSDGNTYFGHKYWSYDATTNEIVHSLIKKPRKCSSEYKKPSRKQVIENIVKSFDFEKNHKIYSLSKAEGRLMAKYAKHQLATNPICYKISDGAKSKIHSGKYYFYCGEQDGRTAQILFTKSDMENLNILKVEAHLSRSASIELCDAAIKKNLNNPETFNYHIFDTGTDQMSNGITRVVRGFSAKNGLGMEVDYRATCSVSSSGNTTISVKQK